MSKLETEKQFEVLTPHTASYSEAIAVSEGEVVELGKTDPDNPGWVWCTSADSNEGWVPESFLVIAGAGGRARRDYDAMELTVQSGEFVTVIESVCGWSLCETRHGQRGWIPDGCLAVSGVGPE